MTTLADLSIGESARVAELDDVPALRTRLLEMGLTPGAMVRLIRAAPLGDPLEFAVRGFRLSVRRSDAQAVQVTRDVVDHAR